MDTWKGKGDRASHGGVVRSLTRSTKMDSNGPKLIQMVTIARTSKNILNLFSVTNVILFWTKWTLEREWESKPAMEGWWGHP